MEEFFTNKMRARLNSLDIVALRVIADALGVVQYSKKNKAEIISEICSACFSQEDYSEELSTDDNSVAEPDFFDFSFSQNVRNFDDYINPKTDSGLVSYENVETFNETKVRAGSSVVEYKIVDKDGKEKKFSDNFDL